VNGSFWPLSAEAFVLAGGRSSRMGTDKALLLLDGAPLIAHALGKTKELGPSARIAGSRSDLAAYAPVVEDLRPDCGPLGGIEAALAASESDLNVFIPVDVPLLPSVFLQWMLTRAAITGASAIIPLLLGRPQPLCSVLRRGLLPAISLALDQGKFKVMDALTGGADADLFSLEAVAPTQKDWPMDMSLHLWFQNLNRPEDLDTLRLTAPTRQMPFPAGQSSR